MPKIINDLKKTIIAKARPLIFTEEYDKLTMRSIAASCSVAVGTIYNYFPSKDVLFAHIILEDWIFALSSMRKRCEVATDEIEGLQFIFDELTLFIKKYRGVWENAKTAVSAPMMFRERHVRLISQLAEEIMFLLSRFERELCAELPCFLAESLLAYANGEKEFITLVPILQKLLQTA